MKDWREAPVFGECEDGAEYRVRASAFGVVEGDNGQIAIVRTPQGYYLPGGGIEPGETPAEAMERETLEECGLVVRAGRWLICAVQFAWSEPERTHFEKQCTFIDGVVGGPATAGIEEDHELVWMTPAEACAALSHRSHAWAVDNWRTRKTGP